MKYAVNFLVTINWNRKISLFNTGTTISCLSKACFDKLQPQQNLVRTNTYRVNSVNGNILGPIGMTTCTLEFPQKFHQQFIVCENLFGPVILGLDFSHNYLIGIHLLSPNQLHLQQGPRSIVTSDPAPFPLHVNQIFTLSLPNILIKAVSQITIPPRMIAIIPTTFNGIPKPRCHYGLIECGSSMSCSNISLLYWWSKFLGRNCHYPYYAQLLMLALMKLSCPKTDTLVR